jgi:hypothetical protein
VSNRALKLLIIVIETIWAKCFTCDSLGRSRNFTSEAARQTAFSAQACRALNVIQQNTSAVIKPGDVCSLESPWDSFSDRRALQLSLRSSFTTHLMFLMQRKSSCTEVDTHQVLRGTK